MLKLWRKFVFVVTVITCFWLIVIRLHGLGGKDYRTKSFKSNESQATEPMISQSQIITLCPRNKDRESFAALLAHWHQLATFYTVPYVIGCGSLLGQYRDGDIIPWDEDVDVLVDIEKFKALEAFAGKRNFEQGSDDKFHFVVQQEFERREEDDRTRLSCTGKVVHEQMDGCSFISPMGRVIYGYVHLDVFPYIIHENKEKVLDLDMNINYTMKDFFPFKECVFMNVETWCPRNVRGILEDAYDDLKPYYNCVNGKWVQNKS